MSFIFNTFRAVDDLETWSRYMQGHAQVLLDFGITNLTSHKESWIENPNVHVVVAYNDSGEMIGGIKLHTYHPDFQLPVELAIGYMDPVINELVSESAEIGCGEICGLWIKQGYNRLGLAHFLSRSAIAISSPLNARRIFGISSPFTLNMFLVLGYTIMESLGDKGNYLYPTEEFISTAVMIEDTTTLEHATALHRTRAESLRSNPIQSYLETHFELSIQINYNLSVHQIV